MSVPFTILGKGGMALTTSRGQLVTAPLDYSTPYAVAVIVADTGYNFVSPIAGKRFVITDIILDANKNISATTPQAVVIYEAASATTATPSTTILTVEMIKNTNRIITGLNMITSTGKWINIKCEDTTINATIMGYYVSA